ncbi:MAG: hypothetical protein R3B74_10425 [Nitrospirales bacterium]|nr:hypothetical protein [Nitrospirales bacterium]
MKEATARIKINKLLEAAGWRFFGEGDKPDNIQLEPSVTLRQPTLIRSATTSRRLKEDLSISCSSTPEASLSSSWRPKQRIKIPWQPKSRQCKYAHSQNCRFIILSNGNSTTLGSERATLLSSPRFQPQTQWLTVRTKPNPQALIEEQVGDDYIVLTQRPSYASEAAWKMKPNAQGTSRRTSCDFYAPIN